MNARILKGILLLLSIGLAILLVVLHYTFTKGAILFESSGGSLQIILYQGTFAAFLLSTAFYIRQIFAKIDRLDVITMLWRLFIIGMVGITLMLAMLMLKRIMVQNFNSSSMGLLAPVFFVGGVYALIIFFLSAVFIFKRFILYQKNRRKLISWNIFQVFLVIALILTVRELVSQPFRNQSDLFTLETVITILFAALLLFLSTSLSWTAYLNFNQKLKALGLFTLIIIVSVTYLMALGQLPEELFVSGLRNPLIEGYLELKFIHYIAAFTLAYSGVSMLVLFFNLPTSSIFELKSSEIANFNKINQAIQGNLEFDEILNTLLDASMLSANAQAGWVLLMESEGNRIHNRKGISEDEVNKILAVDGILENLMAEKSLFQVKNLRRHKALRQIETRYKALVGLPVLVKNETFGLLFVMNEVSNSFEDVTLGSLSSFAEQAGTAIENANLIKNAISLERYEEQLKIAKEVQSQLLPSELPISDRVQFAVISETADEVGGDYFDILQEGEDIFKIAIGDVSGKGTTAAFYMAEVKGIFHALSLMGANPIEFVTYANSAIAKCFQKGFFFTMTYLELDLGTKKLEMIRAGHCPSFFYQKGTDSIGVHREGTLGLGLVRDTSYKNYVKEAETIAFEEGDFMVLYTDGIIEARNQDDVEYGYDRFQKVLENNKDADPKDISSAIMDSVHAFAGQDIHDDYTVLIIKFL